MNQFDVIVDNIMERFRTFNAVDVGIFKICILTLGIGRPSTRRCG